MPLVHSFLIPFIFSLALAFEPANAQQIVGVTPSGVPVFCDGPHDKNERAVYMDLWLIYATPGETYAETKIGVSFQMRVLKCVQASKEAFQFIQVEDRNPLNPLYRESLSYVVSSLDCITANDCKSRKRSVPFGAFDIVRTRDPNGASPYFSLSPFTETVQLNMTLGNLLTSWEMGQLEREGSVDKIIKVYAYQGNPASLGWKLDLVFKLDDSRGVVALVKTTDAITSK